jgi:hypothetical protein
MSDLDDAYRRHLMLRRLAEDESLRAMSEPNSDRNIELGLVDVGERIDTAAEKIAVFFEILGRRIDEFGFLDVFVTFEQVFEGVRRAKSKARGRRPPGAKGLHRHLRNIDVNLADDYEILLLERNGLAHGSLLSSPSRVPVDEEKQILERVLSIFSPPAPLLP